MWVQVISACPEWGLPLLSRDLSWKEQLGPFKQVRVGEVAEGSKERWRLGVEVWSGNKGEDENRREGLRDYSPAKLGEVHRDQKQGCEMDAGIKCQHQPSCPGIHLQRSKHALCSECL